MTDVVKMDPAVKARWVAALRSGEYEQGRGSLNRDGKFCCLGVLCELAVQDGVILSKISPGVDREVRYGINTMSASSTMPPKEVTSWAGLPHTVGNQEQLFFDVRNFTNSIGDSHSLPRWNDSYSANFFKIADMIEAQL